MARISVVGKAVVLISDVTLEDYKTVYKHRPDALCIKDENGTETFRVMVGTPSAPSKYGVSFCEKTNGTDGLACVTLGLAKLPDTQEELKCFLVDSFGTLITNLGKVEENISSIIDDIKEEKDAVMQSINIIA